MIRRNQAIKIIPAVAAAFALAACTGGDETPVSPPPSGISSPGSGGSVTETPPPVESSAAPEQSFPTERPQTDSFELMTAEGYQQKTAILQQGEGFSLYVFEGFSFDAASGRLTLTDNTDYYVDIERLSANDDLESVRKSAEQELKKFGTVSEHSGELVEHPLGYAELYLQSTGEDGIRDYIVWEAEEGDRYLFRLRNPKGEEASAFAGPTWITLSTVRGE